MLLGLGWCGEKVKMSDFLKDTLLLYKSCHKFYTTFQWWSLTSQMLTNNDQLFCDEEAVIQHCRGSTWYYDCSDFMAGKSRCRLGNAAPTKKGRSRASTAWKPPGCKAWPPALRVKQWPVSSKSFPSTPHQSQCPSRRGRTVRQSHSRTFRSFSTNRCDQAPNGCTFTGSSVKALEAQARAPCNHLKWIFGWILLIFHGGGLFPT